MLILFAIFVPFIMPWNMTFLLLLDVDLLHLSRRLYMCLDWSSLNYYGLACCSHHLCPDQLQLLGVQLDGDLLYLSIGSNNLLDYLDPTWRRGYSVCHLLWLQLDNLRLGLWCGYRLRLLVHSDSLDSTRGP